MFYLKEIISNTLIINKSKFICNLVPIKNVDEANLYLNQIRKKYFDATHNCYAYILGDNLNIQKCSDDGEPQKTAGSPMLEALKKREITDVLAVVTRHFGGTLLGASGLIRAYSDSVLEALNLAKLATKELTLTFNLVCDYKEYNKLIKLNYLNIINASFQKEIILTAKIKEIDKKQLEKDLESIFKNKIELEYTSNFDLI